MTNDSTSPRHLSEEPDTEFAVRTPKPPGWLAVYHETSLALVDADLTATAYRVYFYLASLTDQFNSCYPKQSTIAHRLGIGQAAVSKAVTELSSIGVLDVRHRTREGKRGINVYTLHTFPVAQESRETDSVDLSNIPPRNIDVFPHGITKQEPVNKNHVTTKTRAQESPDESAQSSPPRNTKVSRQQVPINFYPDRQLRAEAVAKGWTEERVADEVPRFIDHHRAKGNLFADIRAAWRTWVSNGLKYDARDTQPAQRNNGGKTQPAEYANDDGPRAQGGAAI